MPYISTRTNRTVTREAEEKLTREMGKAISILPGKSEQWLMLDFEGDCHLHFQGKCDDGIAFLSVRIFGSASAGKLDELTSALTKLVGDTLNVPYSNIYVQYEQCTAWGWNGNNF